MNRFFMKVNVGYKQLAKTKNQSNEKNIDEKLKCYFSCLARGKLLAVSDIFIVYFSLCIVADMKLIYFEMNHETIFNYLNLTPILEMSVLCKD